MYSEITQFRVLPEHVTLLPNANVGWDDGEEEAVLMQRPILTVKGI